jgi:hypothetical protein
MRVRKKKTGKPEPAHFTKDNPVTKLQLWNCFRGRRGFTRIQIDAAHAIIGLNAPRYMIGKGYLEHYEQRYQEFYHLTESGEHWLYQKFKRLLERHPEWREEAINLPKELK